MLIKEAPAVEGLDMNRNFPVEWVTNAEDDDSPVGTADVTSHPGDAVV